MAATAQELERLVVRLVGEGSDYKKTLDDAVAQTEAAAAGIATITGGAMGASNQAMKQATGAAEATAMAVQMLAESEYELAPAIEKISYELEEFATVAQAATVQMETLAPVTEVISLELQELAVAAVEVAAAVEEGAAGVKDLEKAEHAVTSSTGILVKETKELEKAEEKATMAVGRERTELGRFKKSAEEATVATNHAAAANDKAAHAAHAHGEGMKKLSEGMKGAGSSMMGFGTQVSMGVTLPIVGAAAACIKLAADMETTETQFQVLLGKDKGLAILNRLKEFSAVTPFHFAEVSAAGRILLSFGMEQNHLMSTMKMLGDVSGATGKNLEELSSIFGQCKATGTLTGEAFMQLARSGFPVAEIAKTVGTDVKGLKKAMEEGRVPFEALQETFRRLTSAGGQFAGMTEKLGATAAGTWSTLVDNVMELGESFGKELLPYAKQAMAYILELVTYFKALSPEVKRTIIYVAAAAAAVGPLLVVLGGLVSVVGVAVGFIGTLVSTILPWAAGILIVGAAVASLTDYLMDGQLGINAWVGSFRVGGFKISTWFNYICLTIYEYWDWLTTEIEIMWDDLVEPFEEAASDLWDCVKDGVDEIISEFWDLVDEVGDAWTEFVGDTEDTLGPVWDFICDAASDMAEAFWALVDDIGEAVQWVSDNWHDAAGIMWRFMLRVAQGISGAFWDMAKTAAGAVVWLAKKVVDALQWAHVISKATAAAARNGLDGVNDAVAGAAKETGDVYNEMINESLTKSEQRWAAHTKHIEDLNDKHAKVIKDSEMQINQDAIDDVQEQVDALAIKRADEQYAAMHKAGAKPAEKLEEDAIPAWAGGLLPKEVKEHEKKEKENEKQSDFKQVAISRVSVAGLTGFAKPKKQEVEAKGVENRLDKLITLTAAGNAPQPVLT